MSPPPPKLVIEEEKRDKIVEGINIPAQPSSIPSFFDASADTKRSILKSNLRAYEADPVKLTPGLDPSHLSTSPISEPILAGPRVRFSSVDQIFHVLFRSFYVYSLCYCCNLGFRR